MTETYVKAEQFDLPIGALQTSFILKLRSRDVFLESYTCSPWACILTPHAREAHQFASKTSAYAAGLCLGFSFVDLLVEKSDQQEFGFPAVY
jgi:hypothetical protein